MLGLPYPALLALHLLAIVVFLSGLLLNAATLPGMASRGTAEWNRARRLNNWMTTPALALVWLFGLSLAAAGGWFGAGWLQLKIVLVVALSALHGVLSARLRRAGTPHAKPVGYRPVIAMGVLVTAILLLVTVKPGS